MPVTCDKNVIAAPRRKLAPTRKAPEAKAKEFPIGHTATGLDGRLWVVREVTRKDNTVYLRWFRAKDAGAPAPKKDKARPPTPKKEEKKRARKAPDVSAKLFDAGTRAYGFDSRFWVVKEVKRAGTSYKTWVPEKAKAKKDDSELKRELNRMKDVVDMLQKEIAALSLHVSKDKASLEVPQKFEMSQDGPVAAQVRMQDVVADDLPMERPVLQRQAAVDPVGGRWGIAAVHVSKDKASLEVPQKFEMSQDGPNFAMELKKLPNPLPLSNGETMSHASFTDMCARYAEAKNTPGKKLSLGEWSELNPIYKGGNTGGGGFNGEKITYAQYQSQATCSFRFHKSISNWLMRNVLLRYLEEYVYVAPEWYVAPECTGSKSSTGSASQLCELESEYTDMSSFRECMELIKCGPPVWKCFAGSVRFDILKSAVQKFARRGEEDLVKPVAAALGAIAYKSHGEGKLGNVTNMMNRFLVILMEDHADFVDISEEMDVLRAKNATGDQLAKAVIHACIKLCRRGLLKSRRASAFKALLMEHSKMESGDAHRFDIAEDILGKDFLARHKVALGMSKLLFHPSNRRKPGRNQKYGMFKSVTKTKIMAYMEKHVAPLLPSASDKAYDFFEEQFKLCNHKENFLFPIRMYMLTQQGSQPTTEKCSEKPRAFIQEHFDKDWKAPDYVIDMHAGGKRGRDGVAEFITNGIEVDNRCPLDEKENVLQYYLAMKRVGMGTYEKKAPGGSGVAGQEDDDDKPLKPKRKKAKVTRDPSEERAKTLKETYRELKEELTKSLGEEAVLRFVIDKMKQMKDEAKHESSVNFNKGNPRNCPAPVVSKYPPFIRAGKLKKKVEMLDHSKYVRAQLPCGTKPGTWVGGGMFIKEIFERDSMARIYAAYQIFVDKMKPRYGLIPSDLKVCSTAEGSLLIGKDFGQLHDGVYETQPHKKHKGVHVLCDSRAANKVSDTGFATDEIPAIVHILLFRAIFGCSDSHLNNILRTPDNRLISVDEMCKAKYHPDLEKPGWQALFAKRPRKEIASMFDKAFSSKSWIKKHVLSVLNEFSRATVEADKDMKGRAHWDVDRIMTTIGSIRLHIIKAASSLENPNPSTCDQDGPKSVLDLVSVEELKNMIVRLHEQTDDKEDLSQVCIDGVYKYVVTGSNVETFDDIVDLLIEEFDDLLGLSVKKSFRHASNYRERYLRWKGDTQHTSSMKKRKGSPCEEHDKQSEPKVQKVKAAKTWFIRGLVEGYLYFDIGETVNLCRGSENDRKGDTVTLKDLRVSRNHATIKFHEDFAELSDKGSSNGTFFCQPGAKQKKKSKDFCAAYGERVGLAPVKLKEGALFCVGNKVYEISTCPFARDKVCGLNPEVLMSETERYSSHWERELMPENELVK